MPHKCQHLVFILIRVEESHGKPVFCVNFNSFDATHANFFASVGCNRVSISLSNHQLHNLMCETMHHS